MKKTKFLQGFTLIELLVVMSIIAILASIMYGPFQTARRRARDTQSIQDMRTLQNYLAIYADDHKGFYPASLRDLVVYGSVPTRINETENADPNLYNYVTMTDAISGGITGYHLWTHLYDINDALRTDRDCDSTNVNSCWGSTDSANGPTKNAGSGADESKDGGDNPEDEPDQDVCRNLDRCLLDYTN